MSPAKVFLIISSLFLAVPVFSQNPQPIMGKVIVKTGEGERPGGYVNVIVFRDKAEIARGKTLGDGTFELFPKGAYHILPEMEYTVAVEPDKRERKQAGERVKKAKVKVKGADLDDVTIYTSTRRNKDAMKDYRNGYIEEMR